MAVVYKDIELLTRKSVVTGNEKLPVSDTEYITPDQIAGAGIIRSIEQVSVIPTYELGYISREDGSIVSSETTKHVTVEVGDADYVQFLGAYVIDGSSWSTGYAWYRSDDSVLSYHAWDGGANCAGFKEYLLAVPEDAAYFRTTVNAVYDNVREDNFHCYLCYNKTEDATGAITAYNYEKEEIDISQVPVETCSAGDTTWSSSGSHISVEVNGGDIVEVVGNANSAGTIKMMCGFGGQANGVSLGYSMMSYAIEAGSKYMFKIPIGVVQIVVNTIVSSANVAPQSLVVYRNKEALEDGRAMAIPCERFDLNGGVLKYINSTSYRCDLFRVKANKRYHIQHRSSNGATYYKFMTSYPRIGQAYSDLWEVTSSATYSSDSSFDFNASADGYIYARTYASAVKANIVVTQFYFGAVNYGLNDEEILLIEQSLRWRTVKYSEPERLNYVINFGGNNPYGRWGTSTSSKHFLIPVAEGQYVKFIANRGNTAVAFLTSTDCASGAYPPYVEGTGITSYDGDNTRERLLKVPAGAKYMYFNRSNAPEYIELSEDIDAVPVIVRVNEEEKTKQLLGQLKSQTRNQKASGTENKPLVLLHFSDIHGMGQNLSRINEYRKYWSKYIDDTINTGDVQQDKWEDDFIFGEASVDNPNNDILSVIGNHDTATGINSTRNWHDKQGKESYDRYVAPFVQYWGVVQPDDAAANGYCFYYKDYPDSHIRLIVLDSWNNESSYIAAQTSWLEEVLNSAREAGYAVIMAAHMGLESEELIKCPFTNNGAAYTSPDLAPLNNPYMALVTQFKADGGELICWLAGHSHYDAIARTSEANGYQINIRVANASRDYNPDLDLNTTNSKIEVIADDVRSQDLFNIVAIDTTYKFITLFRVGAPWDKLGRHIETNCIAYNTGSVVY
jgi:hypothetical protein